MKQVGDLKLFSVPDLSEIMGVSEKTIQIYLKEGKLKGRKFALRWYVTEEDMKAYFSQKQEEE